MCCSVLVLLFVLASSFAQSASFRGFDLTGWTLEQANATSTDGRTIVGVGINPVGFTEAWIAVVPEPGTALFLSLGFVGLAARRRTRALALVLPFVLLIGAESTAAQSDENSNGTYFDFTENGKRHPVGLPPTGDMTEQWLGGKIEPALEGVAESQAMIDVVIYLARPGDALPAVSIETMKRAHRTQIDALSNQLRILDRAVRPTPSLENEQERGDAGNARIRMQPANVAEMERLRDEIDAKRDLMRGAIALATEVDWAASKAAITRLVAELRGQIKSGDFPSGVVASVPGTALNDLGRHPLVRLVLLDRRAEHLLDVSVPSVRFDAWWNDPLVFDGGPFDFGIVDSGVQQDHPAFRDVGAFYTNTGETIDSEPTEGHGTAMTGVVASNDNEFMGGAPGLDAIIWTDAGDSVPTIMAGMHWMVTSAPQSPEVINHSLSYGDGPDADGPTTLDYDANETFYDALIELYDVSVTVAAGNNAWSDSIPTITYPSNAYNVISVAGMSDQWTDDRLDDIFYYNSSVGPTVNGRRKPDLTAPGEGIFSTNSGWATEANFFPQSGTSFAAAHVAAAIILLEDGGNNTPMAQKAVLINTADAWTSNDTEDVANDGPVPGSHWDKAYGWGYLNMQEAHLHRGDYFIGSVVPRNDNATPDDYKLFKGPMSTGDKATLVWQKRATTYYAGAPAGGPHPLTDLNLRIYDEVDGRLVGLDLSNIDNVHQVAADSTIDAVVKVYALDDTIAGASEEPFALATPGNFSVASPPELLATGSVQTWIGPNQPFIMVINVYNFGGLASQNTNVALNNINGITGGETKGYGRIASLTGRGLTFNLLSDGLAAGSHDLDIDVSSLSYGETFTYDTVATIMVETTPPDSDCSISSSYNNTTAIAVPWTVSDTQTGIWRTFLYSRPGTGSFTYTGNGSTASGGTFDYTATVDGPYEFAIRAVDLGGNWEEIPTSAECDLFVDTIVPTATASGPSEMPSGGGVLSWSTSDGVSSSGIDSVEIWYRKEPTATWSSTGIVSSAPSDSATFTPPEGNGTYHFQAIAMDNAANQEMLSGTTEVTTVVPEPGFVSSLLTCLLLMACRGEYLRQSS